MSSKIDDQLDNVRDIHPAAPLIAVGLASGHVETFQLPPLPSSGSSTTSDASALSNGCGTIETLWKTRRHKGSCRTVSYSHDGSKLLSAGTDGLVKIADTRSGRVESKIAVPDSSLSGKRDNPSILHALTPQTLILGTDSAAVHIYDLRDISGSSPSRPAATYHPHDDYISSITSLPPSDTSTSGLPKQWISTGGTTLAVTDVRRGILVKSEDQEEELLSSCFIGDLPKKGSSVGAKVLIGATGVLTLWEKGVWDDQDERISVSPGESLDVIAKLPENIGRHLVAVGIGDGSIRIVKIGLNKVVAEARHDDIEGVISLDFEIEGRMISGGGQTVKVWQEVMEVDEEEDNGDLAGKRHKSDSSELESDEEDDSSEEETRPPPKKRKRRGKGNGSVKLNGISFQDLD